MNAALVEVIIALLGKLIPAIGNNAALITDIINSLQQILPVLVKEYEDLVPIVQNIIAALKGTDGISAEQWTALAALEAQIDSEFEAAAKDEGV